MSPRIYAICLADALKKIKRFNYTGRTLEFKIKPIPPGKEPVQWLRDAINRMVKKVPRDSRTSDQVSFNFCSKKGLSNAVMAGCVFGLSKKKSKYDDLWDMISGAKEELRKYNNYHEECLKRGRIITINNRNNLCLPLALITAISYVNKRPFVDQKAGVTIPEDGCGMDELEQFQRELHGYKIVVYMYGNKSRDVMFEGPNDGKKLNLLYHKGHYNVITSLTSAFCTRFYCQECHKGYFPHLFNTLENTKYVGPLPAVKYYDPDNMKEDARKKFLRWYEEHKNDVFDMQRDLVEYCVSDLEILTKACLKFRKSTNSIPSLQYAAKGQ
ncbi:hypothetical protein NQ317_014054 [Molorchus minor]|uniref:DNA-directed DNA polymerase n=1 Tax=Molorchus minor TaxID=1323400 RepID=A0ABQ9IQZ0_9CUCU|nr:hypothetical protein NQ317_014054 [Molorchus minor]